MFAKLKNCFRLKNRKKILTPEEDFSIPEEFIDSISLDPLNNPIMTRYGHLYSRSEIITHLQGYQTDPLTGQKLTLPHLYEPPIEITVILTRFNALLRRREESNNRTEKHALHQEITALGREMTAVKQTLIDRRRSIETIKTNLKIDIDNPEHIHFWQSKGKGRTTMPVHVHDMMIVASKNHATLDHFLVALNQARYVSRTSRFFKNCFRSNETKQLYNANNENIKTLSFRAAG